MKNAHFLLLAALSLSAAQCSKTSPESEISLEKCNLTGQFVTVENQNGEITFTDEVSGVKLGGFRYVISSELRKLPLLICNYPSSKFPLKEHEAKQITFSAKVEVLPAETDAVSLNAELYDISF